MIKRSNDEYFEIRRKSRCRLRFEVCMHVFGLLVGVKLYAYIVKNSQSQMKLIKNARIYHAISKKKLLLTQKTIM